MLVCVVSASYLDIHFLSQICVIFHYNSLNSFSLHLVLFQALLYCRCLGLVSWPFIKVSGFCGHTTLQHWYLNTVFHSLVIYPEYCSYSLLSLVMILSNVVFIRLSFLLTTFLYFFPLKICFLPDFFLIGVSSPIYFVEFLLCMDDFLFQVLVWIYLLALFLFRSLVVLLCKIPYSTFALLCH